MLKEEEFFVNQLKKKLGDNFIEIISNLFSEYHVVGVSPTRLRRNKEPIPFYSDEQAVLPKTSSTIKLDPSRPKYYYVKAANVSALDQGNLTSNSLIKYEAYRLFLTYCKSGVEAARRSLFSLAVYQPSEVARVAHNNPRTFRFEQGNFTTQGLVKRANHLYIVDENFDWETYELTYAEHIVDYYANSTDEEPIFPKPIVESLPQPKELSTFNEEEPIDWENVKDDDI